MQASKIRRLPGPLDTRMLRFNRYLRDKLL
jgi:hypothetical protein